MKLLPFNLCNVHYGRVVQKLSRPQVIRRGAGHNMTLYPLLLQNVFIVPMQSLPEVAMVVDIIKTF